MKEATRVLFQDVADTQRVSGCPFALTNTAAAPRGSMHRSTIQSRNRAAVRIPERNQALLALAPDPDLRKGPTGGRMPDPDALLHTHVWSMKESRA